MSDVSMCTVRLAASNWGLDVMLKAKSELRVWRMGLRDLLSSLKSSLEGKRVLPSLTLPKAGQRDTPMLS